MKHAIAALAFGAALVASSAFAKDQKVDPAINASTADAFKTVSAWVRTQMDEGGRYQETKPAERARVNDRLDDMAKVFEEKDDVEKMNEQQRMRLFNDQEEVNAILTKRDGQRLVCKDEIPIGSHIPTRVCRTMDEIRFANKAKDDTMRRARQNGEGAIR
jgi:hypothetical protein